MRDPRLYQNEKLIKSALSNLEHSEISTRISAIEFLQNVACIDMEPEPILQAIINAMINEERIVKASFDAMKMFCRKRGKAPCEYTINLVWQKDQSEFVNPAKHIDFAYIFHYMKQLYGRPLAMFFLCKMRLDDPSLEDNNQFEYFQVFCTVFERRDIIDLNLFYYVTIAFQNKISYMSHRELMFQSNLVDYLDLARTIFPFPGTKSFFNEHYTLNDLKKVGGNVLIKANEYREKTRESDEQMKDVIDRYLKLLFPDETMEGARKLLEAKVLTFEEFITVEKKFNKYSKFFDNWLKPESNDPQSFP